MKNIIIFTLIIILSLIGLTLGSIDYGYGYGGDTGYGTEENTTNNDSQEGSGYKKYIQGKIYQGENKNNSIVVKTQNNHSEPVVNNSIEQEEPIIKEKSTPKWIYWILFIVSFVVIFIILLYFFNRG